MFGISAFLANLFQYHYFGLSLMFPTNRDEATWLARLFLSLQYRIYRQMYVTPPIRSPIELRTRISLVQLIGSVQCGAFCVSQTAFWFVMLER
jgi:hypothetical protein